MSLKAKLFSSNLQHNFEQIIDLLDLPQPVHQVLQFN